MIEVIFFLLLPINIVAQQIVIAPAEEINLDCITETIYFQGFYFDSSGTPYFPIQRTNLRGEVDDESKIFSKMEKEESDFELVKFEGSQPE